MEQMSDVLLTIKNKPNMVIMEELNKLPFRDVHQIINFYIHNKRGRIKALDIDQEIRAKDDGLDLRWECCCFAIQRGVELAPLDHRRAFWLRYAKEWPDNFTVGQIIAEIGKRLHRTPNTLYTWINDIKDNIALEAEKLELIPPKDNG